jgi:hypothetical protein
LAFVFKVKHRLTSWPRVVDVRRERRLRGLGRAIGVEVWEGMVSDSERLGAARGDLMDNEEGERKYFNVDVVAEVRETEDGYLWRKTGLTTTKK